MTKERIICLLLICMVTTGAFAQPAIGWRGPDRNGSYPDTNLLKSWPTEGPKLLWSVSDVGKGYSSPTVSGDKVFVTGMDEDEKNEILTAYSLDGKRIFQTTYGKAWDKSYPETRTTPTLVGDKVYVISGMGEVVCLNANNGSILWKVDGKDFGVQTNRWGVSESPLVFDGKVMFTPGGEQTTMVALDTETGKTVWRTPSLNDLCAHVSPLLITHNGIKQIVGFSEDYVFGVNPSTGEIVWKFNDWGFVPERGMDGICINTPLFSEGKLFISNAYKMRSHMLELNEDATSVKLLWRNDDLSVHTGGMVLLNGIIYASNWFNNNNGDWAAIDWNTGQTRYKSAWEGHSKGSVITADGLLYYYEERKGILALVNPTPEKLDIISEFRIPGGSGPHWSHPVIHKGILYIRHGMAVMAYQISKSK